MQNRSCRREKERDVYKRQEQYNVEARIIGFESEERIGIQIFAGERSELFFSLVPTRISCLLYTSRCV